MKKLLLSVIPLLVITICSSGQLRKTNGKTYSHPMQIDSSNYYIIGSCFNKIDRNKYSFQTYNYTNQYAWTNAYIYNSATNKTASLFSTNPIYIYPLNSNVVMRSPYNNLMRQAQSEILKDCIIFCVKTDEYNKDGIIDEDDPVSLFITTKSFENLTRITPTDMNVVSWSIDSKEDRIFVLLQKDKNADKKFTDEDDLLYIITLNDDFSKIKMTQINLP